LRWCFLRWFGGLPLFWARDVPGTREGHPSSGKELRLGNTECVRTCVIFARSTSLPAASGLRAADRSSCACCFRPAAGSACSPWPLLGSRVLGLASSLAGRADCLIARSARQGALGIATTGLSPAISDVVAFGGFARTAMDELLRRRLWRRASKDRSERAKSVDAARLQRLDVRFDPM